jgi:hypothetical protein
LVQQAFYNGWKSIHGIKHQTIDNAYGFTIDMYGPESLRRNDLQLFFDSNINDRMHSLFQQSLSEQYVIFGDSAYCRDTNISSYRDNVDWNYGMKSVRISIEWNYAVTAALFPFVLNKGKLKLLHSNHVSAIYTCATILRNFHCAFYGNETLKYFNASLPQEFYYHYVNQIDFEQIL